MILKTKPAKAQSGYQEENHWTWDGSVIQDNKGIYHMFASRWSKDVPFHPNWITNSAVVRATSQTPEGPYIYQETVIKPRGEVFWDGKMSHNPVIKKYKDQYLLFYTGTTYNFDIPNYPINGEQHTEARLNQRIGMLVSDSLEGPWTRFDKPIFAPTQNSSAWDSGMTTNPSPCIQDDGSILLIYKAISAGISPMKIGVAKANKLGEPFKRLSDQPIFSFNEKDASAEDPFVWFDKGRYNVIMKDMEGKICGQKGGGVFATSTDAIHWDVHWDKLAYSREILWENGENILHGNFERPSLLFDTSGKNYIFAATSIPHFKNNTDKTWVMCQEIINS